jgi:N-acetylmuramate 1-kinase
LPQRLELLTQWLHETLGNADCRIEPASGDASFRRYFRVWYNNQTLIAMDAPPNREDCSPYLHVAEILLAMGLHVPQILARNLKQGFLLLSDLGTRLYLPELSEASVDRLYGDALGALATLQACGPRDGELPPYDHALLMREMALFPDWYLQQHLGMQINSTQRAALDESFDYLAQVALEQPRVCVHRDYHSRNLMITPTNNPGILDFQDAVIGPVTYDLVSLLRDAYIAWPRARVEDWVRGYHELAVQSGILQEESEADFLRWFDLMGVQRHLKVVGIFARLNHRDGKPGYLNDIPRVLDYIRDVVPRYPELASLQSVLQELHVVIAD